MTLITTAYFKRNLNIGDISEGESPIVGNTTNTDFIPFYEKEYLKKSLGYSLWKALDTALTDADDVVGDTAQKWQDLINGVEYTVGSRTYKWDGFLNDDKKSPIANYIYCKYMEANYVATTTIGVAANNIQNATRVSPTNQIWMAWLEMRVMTDCLHHYLTNNKDTYTELNTAEVECFGSVNGFDL
jgi:hypothetical protein